MKMAFFASHDVGNEYFLRHTTVKEYPLHNASGKGDVQALNVLLTSGLFNVNQGNYDLSRPLHEACLAGHLDCAVLLCNYGADVNLRNIDGSTALCDACSKGSLDCVELLLQQGALVNLPFLLITPLHEAVLGNNWHCITTLLQHGANLEASDLDYGTPLQTAVSKGFIECATILLRAGAQGNACKNHQTPLHSAAKASNSEMLCLLLEHGADAYLRDARGRRPIELVSPDNPEIVDLLQHHENTPKSLRQICRLKIRTSLGTRRLKFLSGLRLPNIVIRFLEFT